MNALLDSALRSLTWAANQSKDWSASLSPDECRALLEYIDHVEDVSEDRRGALVQADRCPVGAHNPDAPGSTPGPATTTNERDPFDTSRAGAAVTDSISTGVARSEKVYKCDECGDYVTHDIPRRVPVAAVSVDLRRALVHLQRVRRKADRRRDRRREGMGSHGVPPPDVLPVSRNGRGHPARADGLRGVREGSPHGACSVKKTLGLALRIIRLLASRDLSNRPTLGDIGRALRVPVGTALGERLREARVVYQVDIRCEKDERGRFVYWMPPSSRSRAKTIFLERATRKAA